jgi:hypothetical protein
MMQLEAAVRAQAALGHPLAATLLPLLAAAGAGAAACVCVVPQQDMGDLLVVALQSGAMWVFRGSQLARPSAPATPQPSLHHAAPHQRHHGRVPGGVRGGSGGAAVVPPPPCAWQLLWVGDLQGNMPQHVAAAGKWPAAACCSPPHNHYVAQCRPM